MYIQNGGGVEWEVGYSWLNSRQDELDRLISLAEMNSDVDLN